MKSFARVGLAVSVCILALGPVQAGQPSTRPASTWPSTVVAPGAQLERVADTYSFTEGPAADAQGNVYFTDQPNDRIIKWSTDGKLSVFMEKSGRSNGLCFDAAGNLLACADEKNELWSISPDGKATVLIKDQEGKLLNGPNDLWVAPNGNIYLTDPLYKRPYWSRGGMEQPAQDVFVLSADHKTLKRIASDFKQPNGIVGTPDGRKLYISDIGAGRTYSYDIADDGSLTNRQLFCQAGSDGMTIDNEGNVYLTGKGVLVFNPAGQQIDHIPVPGAWTANVCFGGTDRQTLFITASKAVYTLRTRTKGVGSN